VAIDQEGTGTFSFLKSGEGKFFYLCYSHVNESYKLYTEYVMEVRNIDNFTAISGSTFVAVVDQDKPLVFRGYGIEAGDRAKFVSTGSFDCDDSSRLATLNNADIANSMYIDGNATATFNFDDSETGITLALCYKFSTEDFIYYNDTLIDVASILSLDSDTGSSDVAVVDVE